MYIDGHWIQTKEVITVVNPATQEVVEKVSKGSKEDAIKAVESAKKAFKTWSKTIGLERAQILEKIAHRLLEEKERLAHLITVEMGKPFVNAQYEVESSASYFKWFAEEARRIYGEQIPSSHSQKRLLSIKQPVGVIAAITPWNFPLQMLSRKLGPALAAGCTCLVRPSNQAPLSAIELMKIFDECGLPAGVCNLVIGAADEITNVWLESPDVRKISFTGSTEVGIELLKKSADTVKKVSMELGGHAPFIVFEDADIDLAVEGAITTKFASSGQQCVCSNRIYVQEAIYDTFVEKYAEKVKQLRFGNGLDPANRIGPLINKSAVAKMEEQVEDALQKGASLICGGKRPEDPELQKGYFFEPTVLCNVNDSMVITQEETFGPIAPVLKFKTEEEVLERANNTIYGLAAYFYTNDLSRSHRVFEALEYGIIGINDAAPFTVQAPFGGWKASGLGSEGGHGIDEYLEVKLGSFALSI
ncbi:NAD-dependent succinate-semialdehyde dehydrogenase [Lysinibacillus endophyticus]|uniref:NAD-dependent succinate-semialdehyde dehydrogenase n=1 Tax=Ureibacillus endophyticus TaxID=1978490 RepID=UPI00209FB8FE|nr:NAD-dependent succinate-semialdehyde dehydrogenase [Lysinibacillus endophyticus]MCP1146677.1 NAD-dependent succinate-semialdehyde dehydrogenase [Lysinibacillus endophyticus]